MIGKGIVGTLAAVAIVFLLGSHAEAQLAKKGTYSGHFGWTAVGETIDVGEGRQFFAGQFNGTFFNDAGKGFLHGSSWVCPGVTDNINNIGQSGHGYCVVTDQDGDKALLTWEGGKDTKPGEGKGTFQWTSGTGKYAGIKGDNTYETKAVLPTAQGHNVHKGEWQLP